MKRFLSPWPYFLLFLFSACASVAPFKMSIPVPQLESPETGGSKNLFSFGAGFKSAKEIQFTPNTLQVPPQVDDPKIERSENKLELSGAVSVLERMDVGAKLVSNTYKGTFKYQVLGASRKEKKPGFVLSPFLALGFQGMNQKDSGVDVSSGRLNFVDAKSRVGALVGDIGILYGYRVADFLLLYGNGYLSRSWYSGEVEQSISGNRKEYSFSGTIRQRVAGLGVALGNDAFSVLLEGAYAKASFEEGGNSNLYGSVGLIFYFGSTASSEEENSREPVPAGEVEDPKNSK